MALDLDPAVDLAAQPLVQPPDLLSGDIESEPQSAGSDRRENARYSVEGWAEVMTQDGTMFIRGRISDISSTGCYIESYAAFELPLNSVVEVIFRLKGEEFRPLASTKVVRPGVGAGFIFLKVNPRLRSQLESLISILSEQI